MQASFGRPPSCTRKHCPQILGSRNQDLGDCLPLLWSKEDIWSAGLLLLQLSVNSTIGAPSLSLVRISRGDRSVAPMEP